MATMTDKMSLIYSTDTFILRDEVKPEQSICGACFICLDKT